MANQNETTYFDEARLHARLRRLERRKETPLLAPLAPLRGEEPRRFAPLAPFPREGPRCLAPLAPLRGEGPPSCPPLPEAGRGEHGNSTEPLSTIRRGMHGNSMEPLSARRAERRTERMESVCGRHGEGPRCLAPPLPETGRGETRAELRSQNRQSCGSTTRSLAKLSPSRLVVTWVNCYSYLFPPG